MRYARPADKTAGENPFFVILLRFLDAVGRHQNRAGKSGEFILLILPRAAVIAGEVLELFQFRVAVRREHFAMRVNVDAFALGLDEQFLEVFKVVAGNENRLAFQGFHAHRRRHGMPVGAGVRGVEQFHDAQIHLAALEVEREQFFHRRNFLGEMKQRLADEGINGIIFVAEHQRVFGVGGHALETVKQQLLQTRDVRAKTFPAREARHRLALGNQRFRCPRGRPRGRAADCLQRLCRPGARHFDKASWPAPAARWRGGWSSRWPHRQNSHSSP